MVSAYATASATATPRSVKLVIADDVSQNALSTFIGAFIFSIVGLTAMKNGRVFDYDPRFGLVVLSEIAIHALSPAVNDPGTAIDVIGRLVRLFVLWIDGPRKTTVPRWLRLRFGFRRVCAR